MGDADADSDRALGPRLFWFNNRIFCMGGEGTNRVYGQNEAFDPATGRWESHAPMLTPRHGMGAVVLATRSMLPAAAPDGRRRQERNQRGVPAGVRAPFFHLPLQGGGRVGVQRRFRIRHRARPLPNPPLSGEGIVDGSYTTSFLSAASPRQSLPRFSSSSR